MYPNASERIQTRLKASERIRMCPNVSERVPKLLKTFQNAIYFANIRENYGVQISFDRGKSTTRVITDLRLKNCRREGQNHEATASFNNFSEAVLL